MSDALKSPLGTPTDERSRRGLWFLVVALGATTLLGLGMFVAGWTRSTHPEDLWLEIARGGMQLVLVGVIGTAISAGWRWTEQRRSDQRRDLELRLEDAREAYERRLATFLQVVTAYNGVKAVRRTLKSLGFKSGDGAIDGWQANGFHAQMARLNELQLEFEAVVRELEETSLFDTDTGAIRANLSAVEKYLNGVLSIWEDDGARIREGSPMKTASEGLKAIVEYTSFKAGIVTRRREVTVLMHKHLAGNTPANPASRPPDGGEDTEPPSR